MKLNHKIYYEIWGEQECLACCRFENGFGPYFILKSSSHNMSDKEVGELIESISKLRKWGTQMMVEYPVETGVKVERA